MTAHKRRMKPYRPRKSSHSIQAQKQQLADFEHLISMDVNNFLVLIEEGTPEQATMAQQKTKNDLLKYGADMQKIADQIGGKFPKAVHDFLDSVDSVVHSATAWIDEAKIMKCYTVTKDLESELHSA